MNAMHGTASFGSLSSSYRETTGLPLEAMDQLFGVAEMTDAEKAVLGYGEKGISVSHHEHAGYADAASKVGRTNTVTVMAPVSELSEHQQTQYRS
jgi:hypothetical protein